MKIIEKQNPLKMREGR